MLHTAPEFHGIARVPRFPAENAFTLDPVDHGGKPCEPRSGCRCRTVLSRVHQHGLERWQTSFVWQFRPVPTVAHKYLYGHACRSRLGFDVVAILLYRKLLYSA